ncbi:MAG: preprotein translocase subunit YajC [Actinomycetales bacterium]|nr:preprotein translocase subunit YajC [Actinomycetales bacterium]
MDPILVAFVVLALGGLLWMNTRAKKQQRTQGAFRDNLEIGQQVMTGSGMFGVITMIDGDAVTIESAPGNASVWLRAAIAKLAEPPVAEAVDDDDDDDDDVDDEVDDDDDDVDDEVDDDDDDVDDSSAPRTDTTGDRGFLSPDELRKPYREGDNS